MNKTKFRILSKIALIFVFIGFFMPISCNLNGFQLAQVLESVGGTNPLSISLYVIFIGSCVGIILFFVLLANIKYDTGIDWVNIIAMIIAFIYFIHSHIKDKSNSILGSLYQLQSGAYIIFFGLAASLIFLYKSTEEKDKSKDKDTTDSSAKLPDN